MANCGYKQTQEKRSSASNGNKKADNSRKKLTKAPATAGSHDSNFVEIAVFLISKLQNLTI